MLIMQRFIPADIYISDICSSIINEKFQAYFNETIDIEFSIVDAIVFNQEKGIMLKLDELSKFNKNTDVKNYILTFSNEEKLFLIICFDLIRLHPSEHVQYLPAFPTEDVYKNFFAFVQFKYEQFKKECFCKNISFSKAWTEMRLDNNIEGY